MENWYKGNIIYNYNWVYKKTKNKFLFFNFVKKYISNIKTSIDTTGFEKWYKNDIISYLYKTASLVEILCPLFSLSFTSRFLTIQKDNILSIPQSIILYSTYFVEFHNDIIANIPYIHLIIHTKNINIFTQKNIPLLIPINNFTLNSKNINLQTEHILFIPITNLNTTIHQTMLSLNNFLNIPNFKLNILHQQPNLIVFVYVYVPANQITLDALINQFLINTTLNIAQNQLLISLLQHLWSLNTQIVVTNTNLNLQQPLIQLIRDAQINIKTSDFIFIQEQNYTSISHKFITPIIILQIDTKKFKTLLKNKFKSQIIMIS